MSVHLHQLIPVDCTSIASGTVLRLFDAKCTYNLHTFPTAPASVNAYKNKIPRSTSKDALINYERSKQITLCDVNNATKPFARRNFLIRGKVRKHLLCPFDYGLRYRIGYAYGEATGPNNGVNTPQAFSEFDWPDSQNSVTHIITTASIGDPHGRVSEGKSSFTLTLTLSPSSPTNSCAPVNILIQATLNSMGKAVDAYAGTPVIQNRTAGCISMQLGQTVGGFWTGINYEGGPIGLVMSTSWSVGGFIP